MTDPHFALTDLAKWQLLGARAALPALADDEDVDRYLNHYDCPDCGTTWDDEWSCACDDDCPECGTTCETTSSEVLEDADLEGAA